MPVIDLELLPAVAYDRPDIDGMRPILDGYSLEQLTIVRADQVRPGDLVVGSVDQPLKRGSLLRWATYLAAPYVAQPGPYEADCPSCRNWTSGAEAQDVEWTTLAPHCPELAAELISIVPAPEPVKAAASACVHTCTCNNGHLRQETRSFYPPAICGECHARPCAACREAGFNSH
jgi:hypothetical protein